MSGFTSLASVAVFGLTQVRVPLQLLAISLVAVVAGGTFTIWRGYDPRVLSAGAFVEMHQGAVTGLNVLLPAIGAGAMVATLVLLANTIGRGTSAWLYAASIVFMVAAGLVTRFGNQPINAMVMTWTPDALPLNWMQVRDRWWLLHEIRTAVTCAAFLLLVIAVQLDLLSPATPKGL